MRIGIAFTALVSAAFTLVIAAGPSLAPAASPVAAQHWTADNGNGTYSNPLFYEEFEDPNVIRVGEDYYLAGTTMHMNPSVQLMHSKDLVNWELVGYCADRLDLGPAYRLEDGSSGSSGGGNRGGRRGTPTTPVSSNYIESTTPPNHLWLRNRYLTTSPDNPGPVTVTARGPRADRKDGACFKWKLAE